MVQKLVNVSVADLYREPTFASERTTQALLGERVELLERHEDFSLIRTGDRYEGWVADLQLCGARQFPHRRATARSHHFPVHAEPDGKAPQIRDVVIGCRLAYSERQDGWLQLVLPDGAIGWAQAEHFGALPALCRQAAVDLAMEFLGYPYCWGGKSPKGLDCSGLVQLVFSLLQKPVPRDAVMQYREGRMLSERTADAEPGDLYFFGTCRETVDHVGIALGNCKLIHASGMVRINSLNPADPDFHEKMANRFLAAKTLFDTQ